MPFDPEALLAHQIPERIHDYGTRDTLLYALGIGLGVNEKELPYVAGPQPLILPTMAVILGYPGFWMSDPSLGIDWRKVLHGEQEIEIHRPLPADGQVSGRSRIVALVDKGAERGSALAVERDVVDRKSGELLCRVRQVNLLRGNGGWGRSWGEMRPPHTVPDRAPDLVRSFATSQRAALIYALSGDANPLHTDPHVARAAGYPRPILHGLCTFGVAGYALVAACCDGRPERLASMQARFTAPVFPGEELVTEMWIDRDAVSFRTRVPERDAVVIGNGLARIGC